MPGFDPSRFEVNVACGTANGGGDRGPTQISFNVNLHATDGISVGIIAANSRKEVFSILGAEGWPQFLKAVRECEKVIKQMMDEKRADELRALVPGQR